MNLKWHVKSETGRNVELYGKVVGTGICIVPLQPEYPYMSNR